MIRTMLIAFSALVALSLPCAAHTRHHKAAAHHTEHKKPKHVRRMTHTQPSPQPSSSPTPISLSEAFDIFIGRIATASVAFGPPPPEKIAGTIEIAGAEFKFVSGGFGYSIPYGVFPITPDDMGDWGRVHGALGINGNVIWDSRLQRDRVGIELHQLRDPRGTDGCIGIVEYPRFKLLVLNMIATERRAFLHILPDRAYISPEPFQ